MTAGTDDQEGRRNWRRRWLGSIQEIADIEMQRRMWLNPDNDNPHFSFVEYQSCYFDDLGLLHGGYERRVREGFLVEAEVEAVTQFHRIFDSYHLWQGTVEDRAVLADPRWSEVVSAARNAQALLLKLISDPSERQHLTEPLAGW